MGKKTRWILKEKKIHTITIWKKKEGNNNNSKNNNKKPTITVTQVSLSYCFPIFLSHYNHRVHAILFSLSQDIFSQSIFPHYWSVCPFTYDKCLLACSGYHCLKTVERWNIFDSSSWYILRDIDRLTFKINVKIKYMDFIFLHACFGKNLTPIWCKMNFFAYWRVEQKGNVWANISIFSARTISFPSHKKYRKYCPFCLTGFSAAAINLSKLII